MVFSVFLAAAFITCLMIFLVKNTRFSLRIYQFAQSVPLIFICVFLGGKTLALINGNPWGFVFYGALIGLITGIFLESRRRKISMLIYTDTFLRLLPIGQAIGRIGCYFNGCCYGTLIIPVQFIESGFCLALGTILLLWQTNKTGRYTFAYLSAYSLFRFFLEFFREDEIRGFYGVFSTSQWISIAIIFVLILNRKHIRT